MAFFTDLFTPETWRGFREHVDSTPIFTEPDPFVIRFKVRPLVVLDPELSIPIFDDALWPKLSFTKKLELRSPSWAQFANLRASLRALPIEDGTLLAHT